MAKGRATERIPCPNFEKCRGHIEVTFVWWDYPAFTPRGEFAPTDPPDKGAEVVHFEPCDECEAIPSEEYVDNAVMNLEFDYE